MLPVGSFEQHGDHLPLTTDTVVAKLIAQLIATDYDLFLLPPVTLSCSHEHAHMPGWLLTACPNAVIGLVEGVATAECQGPLLHSGHGTFDIGGTSPRPGSQ